MKEHLTITDLPTVLCGILTGYGVESRNSQVGGSVKTNLKKIN